MFMMITILIIIATTMIWSIAAHDELGTCRASLVGPEQSIPSIPKRSLNTTSLTVMQRNTIVALLSGSHW